METLGIIVKWLVAIGPMAYRVIKGLIDSFSDPKKAAAELEAQLVDLIGGEYKADIQAILAHPDVIASREARLVAAEDARRALGLPIDDDNGETE